VTAGVTYGLWNANGDTESLSTVFSSQQGVYQQFLATGEIDLAFAITNDTDDLMGDYNNRSDRRF
jgi:hypothetical protein